MVGLLVCVVMYVDGRYGGGWVYDVGVYIPGRKSMVA